MISQEELAEMMGSLPEPEPPTLPTFDITGAPNRPARPLQNGPGYVRCSCCGAEFPEDAHCPYWQDHI